MREEENQNSTSKGSNMQKALRKRWVFPAIYIASAAILLTGVLWFQSGSDGDSNVSDSQDNGIAYEAPDNESSNASAENEALEVMASKENIQMPVQSDEEIFIKQQFYDSSASSADQEAALVFYNNTYYPNTGIDYAMESGESFDVVAAISGTVVEAEEDSLLGNVVTLEHENGVTTHYSSLGDLFVEVGQQVDQGTVIGSAGNNIYNKDAGIHVHFEIRKDQNPINPLDAYEKPIASLEDLIQKEVSEEKESAEQVSEDDGSSHEDAEKEEGTTPEADAEKEKGTTPEEDASISMTRA